MPPIPITMTQLLKDPHSVQAMVEKGQKLLVFSRSKPIFEIQAPSQKPKKKAKKFEIPTISVPIMGSLSRKEMYSENSWLDQDPDEENKS